MNNSTNQNTNERFNLVKEEMKRLLSIVLYSIQESQEDNNFDYYIDNATTSKNAKDKEDAKIAKYLKKDMFDREKRIEEYEISKQKIRTSTKRKQIKSQPDIEVTDSIIQNEKLAKNKEEHDIEL